MSTGCGTSWVSRPPRADADAEALADRLTAPLDSAIRLALLEALSDAAQEITRELAPGSVDVRLRGRDPEFTVSPGSARRARTGRRGAGGRRRRRHVAGDAAAAGEPAVAGRCGGARRRAVGERVAGPRRRVSARRQTPDDEPTPTSTSAAGSADHEKPTGENDADIRTPQTRSPPPSRSSAVPSMSIAT